jgi:hypothetical protein
MAAVSCANTQIPETTVATQSLPKVGFRKAIQLEVLVIRIEAKCCSKLPQHHYAAIAYPGYKFEEEVAASQSPEAEYGKESKCRRDEEDFGEADCGDAKSSSKTLH